jgi:tRNA nucleotidyltransferase (CCA-adding enzyme)
MQLPTTLERILKTLPTARLIGGAVRDHLLSLPCKDFDVEVYHTTPETLLPQLERFGKLDLVGKSFGVYKLKTDAGIFDFSLPRKDSKVSPGHKGFEIEVDPNLSPKEAATRRDLTINALSFSLQENKIFDYFGGLKDIQEKKLRHTSLQFSEDPLRVLRIFQFAARFEFDIADETATLCQQMAQEGKFFELPKERIGEEFKKFLLKGKNHRLGFQVLEKTGWLPFFKELHALAGLQQDPVYHPEGDVLTHTALCITALTQNKEWQTKSEDDQLALAYGILCHDLGKADTTKTEFKEKENRVCIVSPGHDITGIPKTFALLETLNAKQTHRVRAACLTEFHMAHLQTKTKPAVMKLAKKLEAGQTTLAELSLITEADHSGRPPLLKKQAEQMVQILEIAKEKNCLHAAVPNLLNGKDLLREHIPQGKAFQVILTHAYQHQLENEISEKSLMEKWLKTHKLKLLTQNNLGPEKLLTGHDLKKLGIQPSPEMTRLANEAYALQLEGKIKTKKDAISWAENQIQPTR